MSRRMSAEMLDRGITHMRLRQQYEALSQILHQLRNELEHMEDDLIARGEWSEKFRSVKKSTPASKPD
jgi:hypothetical protein